MKRIFILIILLCSLPLNLSCDNYNDEIKITMNSIICDKFIVVTDLHNNDLHIKIISDLPSNTTINVDVYRKYWEVGSSNNYVISYYSEFTEIGIWEIEKIVHLDNKKWLDDLHDKQELLRKIGEPFEVSEINDSIEVKVIVPLQEDNFGIKNKNLKGKEVFVENINFIRKSIEIHFPYSDFNGKPNSNINEKWIDTSEGYSVGIVYVHQERGDINVDFIHNDGSVSEFEAMKINVGNETRYYIKHNDYGEYFIIKKDGTLYWYDDLGLVMKCDKYQK